MNRFRLFAAAALFMPFLAYGQPVNTLTVYNQLPQIKLLSAAQPVGQCGPAGTINPKICADGSLATLLRYTHSNDVGAAFSFRVKEDPSSANPNQYGSIEFVQRAGNILTARFRHPFYVQSGASLQWITLEVLKDNGTGVDSVLISCPVLLLPAPVLIIPGLFDRPRNYEKAADDIAAFLYPELPQGHTYPPTLNDTRLLFFASYDAANAKGFAESRFTVRHEINVVLARMRKFGFSAGKVDVVGFGLGGVLARLWLQNPQYQNTMRRLVTVLTPHSGSHLAALINSFERVVTTPAAVMGFDVQAGALADLRPDALAVRDVLNGQSINANKVPTHTVSGVFTGDAAKAAGLSPFGLALVHIAGYLQATVPILVQLYQAEANDPNTTPQRRAVLLPRIQFLRSLFENVGGQQVIIPGNLITRLFEGELNDLSTIQPSAAGGLQGTATSEIQGATYFDIGKDARLVDRLNTVLGSQPDASVYTIAGFAPPDVNTRFLDSLNQAAPALFLTGGFGSESSVGDTVGERSTAPADAVIIDSPSRGATVKPGQKVKVMVSLTTNVESVCTSFRQSNSVDIASDFSVDPAPEFEFSIPNDVAGPIKIFARGYLADTAKASQWTAADTVTIFVEPDAALDSIRFEEAEVIMLSGGRRENRVIGYYADGFQRDVTELIDPASFISENNGVVSIAAGGRMDAFYEGETHIRASLHSLTCRTSVTVLPANAFDDEPVGIEPARSASTGTDAGFALSDIYPNPAAESAEARVTVWKPGHYTVAVYDALGRKAQTVFAGRLESGLHPLLFALEGIPNGTYYIHVSSQTGQRAGRLVVKR